MSLANRKVVQEDHNSRNQRGMQHHLLVHLHPKTEVRIVARIHSTSRLGRLSLKEVWHKEVLSLLPAPSMVGITMASVAKASGVVSSMAKRVTL